MTNKDRKNLVQREEDERLYSVRVKGWVVKKLITIVETNLLWNGSKGD